MAAFEWFSFLHSVSQARQLQLVLSLRFSPFRPAAFLAPSLSRGKELQRPFAPNLTWDRWRSLLPSPPLSPFPVPLRPLLFPPPNDVVVCLLWWTHNFSRMSEIWSGGWVWVLYEWNVNIGVKRRGRRDPQLWRRRGASEQLCALRPTQKRADLLHHRRVLFVFCFFLSLVS